MKKSKLTIGLVTTFICGMSLSACVTAHDNYVVEYKDYNDAELGLLSNTVYSDYFDTDDGLTKYYEKVRELLIRASFKSVTEDADETKKLDVKTSYATLVSQAKNKVEEQKETARKNAKNNGTAYSDEMDEIYEAHNCEDEEGLYQHFLLELEEEQLDSAILDNPTQLKILRDGTSNGSEEGWLKNAKPYHIKHMLVKIDGGSTEFTKGTISEDEANKLAKVVKLLKEGSKFDDVASNGSLNDDSSDKLGDVGIMNNNAKTNSLTMVSEFQLGIYTADKLINGVSGDGVGFDSTNKVELGEGEKTITEAVTANGVAKVPYAAFEKLANVAKYPEATEDKNLLNANACVFPRNVLWNKYLNNHSVFVIVNGQDSESTGVGTDTNEFKNLVKGNIDKTKTYVAGEKSGFDANGYLCAEDGKVIFGVRSEYGIHFIKIQKSAFDSNLDTYYPTVLDDAAKSGTNYITALDNSSDTYDSRFAEIKSAIKGYDSNAEYRLYSYLKEYCVNKGWLDTSDNTTKKILDTIDAHIETLKANDVYKQETGLHNVWEDYLRMVELQNTKRLGKWADGFYYTTYTGSGTVLQYKNVNRTALVSEFVGDEFVKACEATNETTKAQYIAKFLEGAGGEYYYA